MSNVDVEHTATPPAGYTCKQALSISDKFRLPPFDHSMLVNEYIDWHMKHSPKHPLAVLTPDNNTASKLEYVTYREIGEQVHCIAKTINDALPDGPLDVSGQPHVVSVITQVDTLVYITTLMGIMRAGCVPFPISSRNSVEGLQHLVTVTKSRIILTTASNDESASAFEKQSFKLVDNLRISNYDVIVIPVPQVADLYPRLLHRPYAPFQPNSSFVPLPPLATNPTIAKVLASKERTKNWPCVLIHSSGSTKFPKPIVWCQQLMQTWSTLPWYGEFDVGGLVQGSGLSLPSFHAVGVATQIGMPMATGILCAMWIPGAGPAFSTPQTILNGMRWTNTKFNQVVADHLERWTHDKEALEWLKTMHVIGCGGGGLSQQAGDTLIAHGVNFQNIYGMTEAGLLFKFNCKESNGEDWEYGEFAAFVKPVLRKQDGNTYRLDIEGTEDYQPAVFNSEFGKFFNTNDLVEEHPTKKGFYKVVGRADDQIIMSNGEKTNPVPIEAIVSGHPLIRSAVMFGTGRSEAGIIIEPINDVDVFSIIQVNNFIIEVGRSIRKANEFAPSHSRIFQELIIVGDTKSKPFPRTAKSTAIRSGVLALYENEITNAYLRLFGAKSTSEYLPSSTDAAHVDQFVANTVSSVMRGSSASSSNINPNMDVFVQGCDSLQATFIRKRLQEYVTAVGGKTLDQMIVYQHPTVTQLSSTIKDAVSLDPTRSSSGKTSFFAHTERMLKLVDKYSANLRPSDALRSSSIPEKDLVVLVTGGNGNLGCYLVYNLLKQERVKKVFVINRPHHTEETVERQFSALRDRGIGLDAQQILKMTITAGDLSLPHLGLEDNVWEEISSSVNLIVHSAWRLDFNLDLTSFEQLLQGVRNLIDMALRSSGSPTPHIAFMSSVGTVTHYPEQHPGHFVPEIALQDPAVAVGTGYGESKWVSEQILQRASKVGVPSSSFRIGQLSGSRTNGSWNLTDWFPHIIAAATILEILPKLQIDMSVVWLPVDVAAQSIVEAILCDKLEPSERAHIVNPNMTTWNVIIGEVHGSLVKKYPYVKVVDFEEWLQALEKKAEDTENVMTVKALNLLEFYKACYTEMKSDQTCREAFGFARVETIRTEEIVPSLKSAKAISRSDVIRWMTY